MSKTAIIRHVRLGVLATAVWLGVSMVGVPSVGAVPRFDLDHLECAKVTKDSNLKEEQLVNLENKFGTESGCKLDTTAVYACVPTIKFRLDSLDQLGDDPRGERLATDMLCYKLKCDKPAKGTVSPIEDQFGGVDRVIQFKDGKYLCTPVAGEK